MNHSLSIQVFLPQNVQISLVRCHSLSARLIPFFLSLFKPLFSVLYNQFFDRFALYTFLTFLECFVLLCLPVICMGATLPILCKFYVNTMDRLGTNAGRLYGLNTIGAALGSLACGFWLLSIWGMQGTLYFAVAINLVIGFTCLLNGFILKVKSLFGVKKECKEDKLCLITILIF